MDSDISWLMDDANSLLLAQTLQRVDEGDSELKILKSLRKSVTQNRARMVMEQSLLRRRARNKFELADKMFFTSLALQQASGQRIANYKASRFPKDSRIADLCCGIGGDLVALARRSVDNRTLGVDVDPVMTHFARRNCEVNQCAAEVIQTQVELLIGENNELSTHRLIDDVVHVHIDPDRRANNNRTTQMDFFQPNTKTVESLVRRKKNCAIKLAPATELPDSWHDAFADPNQFHTEWIGHQRECKQQILWTGDLSVYPAKKTATVLGEENEAIRTVVENSAEGTPSIRVDVDRYIYEPHAAVFAAGLVGSLAMELGLEIVAGAERTTGYLTSADPKVDLACAAFEVIDRVAMRVESVEKILKRDEVGTVEIKHRNVEETVAVPFRQMKLGGSNTATIFLLHLPGGYQILICRRLTHDNIG